MRTRLKTHAIGPTSTIIA